MPDEFLKQTYTQYSNMKARYKRKKLPDIPFTLAEWRDHVGTALGPQGALRCRYCHGWFGVMSIVGDHIEPLDRGGSLTLDNIEFLCRGCNNRKGKLTDTEFDDLLRYLDGIHPLARKDILSRLQIATPLAAADAWAKRREWTKK